jgi:rubredoxin
MKQFEDYQKKPVVIQAAQWQEHGDLTQVARFDDESVSNFCDVEDNWTCGACGGRPEIHGWVRTLEGGHIACPNDWIIRGVEGEYYPCKPAIFEKTYQRPTAIEPIDVMLFCPKCGEIHIDEVNISTCENCGHPRGEHYCDEADDHTVCDLGNCECPDFKGWANPPHKSHRCGNCNFVWRPADVPTNGVAHAKTKGDNDTMKLVGDIRRGKAAA